MTLSPSSIMLKSAIAWPTCRCSRLDSLLISRAARLSGSSTALISFSLHIASLLCFGDAEDFAADRFAVGIHVGLLGRYACGPHSRMRQHQRQDVVAQRFLQM